MPCILSVSPHSVNVFAIFDLRRTARLTARCACAINGGARRVVNGQTHFQCVCLGTGIGQSHLIKVKRIVTLSG